MHHYLTVAAKKIADEAHKDHTYAKGSYLVNHVYKVARSVDEDNGTVAEIAVAFLHDVVEDCIVTYEEIQERLEQATGQFLGIHQNAIASIVVALKAITKVEGEDYDSYIQRVKANPIARKVKRHDSTCNMNQCIKDKDYKRAKKYLKVLVELA